MALSCLRTMKRSVNQSADSWRRAWGENMATRVRDSVVAAALLGLLLFLAACGSGTAAGNGAPAVTRTVNLAAARSCTAQATATPAAPVPATAASASTSDDLSALSDEFNDAASLASWKNLSTVEGWPSQIEKMDVNATSPGALYLVPYTSTWFEDYHGAFLYKEVTGDFMVTTRIKANGKHSAVPTSAFSLSGIMARAPRDGLTPASWTPGHENWVFI